MAAGCRDCSRCTETALTGCVMMPFRLTWWALIFWNVGMVTKHCPQCKHPLSLHARRDDGSFKD